MSKQFLSLNGDNSRDRDRRDEFKQRVNKNPEGANEKENHMGVNVVRLSFALSGRNGLSMGGNV